ncbi:MAG: hypothetical protein C4567_03770 [Deltaproteobacteria bacterium]|nr:MAG: hypothetical protein C4567_03770 [Deltaproteobacteria bacterium]
MAQYEVKARSTETFGRVLCSCRNHHFVVDGPVQNGCPGEAITPVELFLAGVASCGVELIEVIAKDQNLPIKGASVGIFATIDRSQQVHSDLTLFNSFRLQFHLKGVTDEQGAQLINIFKGR